MAAVTVRVEVTLTTREAEELLRAELRAESRSSTDGQRVITRELESAGDKLRDAITVALRVR